jgi:branched-subunit amino acid ABC-type transport system permease component
MSRKRITMALAVLIAGIAGMLAPPLSAASVGSGKHAMRGVASHRDDPIIGYVTK